VNNYLYYEDPNVIVNIQKLCGWVIQTDRRLIVLQAFKREPFVNAAELAQKTTRSVQNISIALNELEGKGLIVQIDKNRRSWKKFQLSEIGHKVLTEIDRQSKVHKDTVHIWQKEMRLVKDAYQLIVSNPCTVYINTSLIEALEKNLEDPRTKNVYVVDDKRILRGVVPLQLFLKIIQKHSLPKLMISKVMENSDCELRKSVQEIMIKPISIRPEEKLTVALKKLIMHELEDIPVIDQRGRLIGELNGLEILTMFKEDYVNRHAGSER
jgi:CBS domain-containing protein